ncbi:MAG: hypothetical protein GQ582_09495 [Methyloprofundus sp.]|nr:hypothetical protein [Methyloprofundus sp.]
MAKNKHLSTELLAELFGQLARLEVSGIPASQAFTLIKTKDKALNLQLQRMQQLISHGSSIAEAGFKVGVFSKIHKALVSAGESSGQLATIYKQQASDYAKTSKRLKKLKSQLYLPIFVLFLALLVRPLPRLISGEIDLSYYLSISLGAFCLMLVLSLLIYKLSLWFEPLFHRLQLQLPKVSGWIIKRQVNKFLLILSQLLEGGLTAAEALPLATTTIKNSVLRRRFEAVINVRSTGETVHETLAKINAVPAIALQMIYTGEISGKLGSALLHFTKHQGELISIDDDALATWIPRWFYVAVVVFGAML